MITYTVARPLLWTLVLAITLPFGAALGASEPDPLPTFSATYSVRYGLLRGAMKLELRRQQDDRYVYETSLRPRGLVSLLRRGEIREVSTLETNGELIRPVDYVSTDTIARPHRRTNYLFDEPLGQVTGEYKSKSVDVPMRVGGQNRISAHIAVMRALQSGGELTEVSIFDRSRWKDYRFEVNHGQTVELPSGSYVVQSVGGDYESEWSAGDLRCY